jgi:hypothetical protein
MRILLTPTSAVAAGRQAVPGGSAATSSYGFSPASTSFDTT